MIVLQRRAFGEDRQIQSSDDLCDDRIGGPPRIDSEGVCRLFESRELTRKKFWRHELVWALREPRLNQVKRALQIDQFY